MKSVLFDFGTTALKITLLNEDYSTGNSLSKKINTYIDRKKITQKTSEWKEVFLSALKELLTITKTTKIKYIIGTGQMEDLLFIDNNENAEDTVTLYNDSYLENQPLDSELASYNKESPNKIDSYTPLIKLLSRKKSNHEFLKKKKRIILGAKDYINFLLTGHSFTDFTNASTTGLFSTINNNWNKNLPKDILSRLPEIASPSSVIGELKKENIEYLNLDNVPEVINGIGDVGASTLGAELKKNGETYIYLGTTGWIATLSNKFEKSEDFFNLSGPFENQWQKIGPLLNAGNIFDWAMKNFLKTEDYNLANKAIKEKQMTDVLSWPYLNGERSPKKNPDVRGSISRISQKTDPDDLFVSFVRSIAFSLRFISEEMNIDENEGFNLIGGLSNSSSWVQMLSDILKRNITVFSSGQLGPQYGLIKIIQRIENKGFKNQRKNITYKPQNCNFDYLYKKYKVFAKDLLNNQTSCPTYVE
jgi:xylulokinase